MKSQFNSILKKNVKATIALNVVFVLLVSSCENTQSDTKGVNPKISRKLKSSSNNLIPPLFDETSITRDYLNNHQGIKWKNTLGDWIDIKGTPQGMAPWASANVAPSQIRPVLLDVTKIIKNQQGKANQLIILSATAPVTFFSREGEHPPILRIIFEPSSNEISLKPTLDGYIARSDYRNLNSSTLHFDSNDFKGYIQFHLPRQRIKKAILELWPKKIWEKGQVQIFNLDYKKKSSEEIPGIASTKSSYAELQTHPDVVFVDTFDDEDLNPSWFQQFGVHSDQLTNGFLAGEGYKYNSVINLRYFFKKNLNWEPIEMYFRYSIRFHKDFIFSTQGGKMPGLAGTYNTCGWGGRKPSEDCRGWSARLRWGRPAQTGAYKDLIPIGTNIAHLDQEGFYEDHDPWQIFCTLGSWCEIEQYVKLNTPKKNDGIIRGFVNGKLVYERKNIRFRDHENIKIEEAWLLVYHGGMGLPTKPIHADIDNVVLSKSYIGLLSTRSKLQKQSTKKITISNIQNRKPNSKLTALSNNTVMDLGAFSCTRPLGDPKDCAGVTDFSGMVYDQNHHQILMFGGGHATTFTDSVFIFDLNSLSWKEDYAPTPCSTEFMQKGNFDSGLSAWKAGPQAPYPRPISRHTYDLLAVASNIPELILMMGPNGDSACPPGSTGYDYAQGLAPIAHYNLKNKTWTFSKTSLSDGRPYYGLDEYTASEYDPVSGMIILLGEYGLYTYNPVDRTKIKVMDTQKYVYPENLGFANQLVYYPPDDSMYYFNRNSQTVWKLKLNRNNLSKSTLKKIEFTGEYPPHGEPGYAFDSTNKIIGGAIKNNRFYIFNPETKKWSSKVISGGTPGNMSFHAIAYDPVNNVFIFLTKGFKTWAYRLNS